MTTSLASSAKPVIHAPTSSLAAFAASGARLMRFLLRNPMTLAGLIVIVTLLIVALFAPWIATHD
ncbi:dipeptide ABC transporter, permease protein DppC, partial [Pseudomonas syringae pv. actinidiae ICMP 18804]